MAQNDALDEPNHLHPRTMAELVGDNLRRIYEANHTFFPTSSSHPGPDCLLALLSFCHLLAKIGHF